MNYHQDELTAEYNRQRIQTEMEQIRLERLALRSKTALPGRFTRLLFVNLANWMIATGKQLRQRYESPAANHGQPSAKEFAR